jgi:hypothetical protein
VTTQTLAEALALVTKAGMSPAAFAAALEHNACRSGTTDIKLPKMVAADYEPHFSLKHMFKDVQLAIHMANALDIEVPATTVTAGVMYGALNHGWADLDFSSVFKLYEGAFADRRAENARPVQIEVPPVGAAEPAGKNGEPPPAKPAPKPEATRIEVEVIASVPNEPERKPAEPERKLAADEPKPMEVVADVPRNAKPAGDTEAAEAAKREAKAPREPEPAPETEKPKPFNRFRRFFSATSGK